MSLMLDDFVEGAALAISCSSCKAKPGRICKTRARKPARRAHEARRSDAWSRSLRSRR